jgi:hypothetical protein
LSFFISSCCSNKRSCVKRNKTTWGKLD